MDAEKLNPPPRSVPLFLGIQATLGGFLQQFGWAFFSFGMLFVMIFGSQLDLGRSFTFATSSLSQVPGVVEAYQETNASQNEVEVVAYIFRFEVEGTEYEGRSYVSGYRFDEGQQVQVEYPAGSPELGRIVGTRCGVFSPWLLLFIGIFPLIGALMAGAGLREGLKGRALLSQGKLIRGKLISKERTNTTVNDRPVMALTFEFTPEGGSRPYTVVAKNHVTDHLEDEETERILYHPRTPSNAVLFDNLPGGAQVTARGGLGGGSFGGALKVLFLPLLGLAFTAVTLAAMIS